MNANSSIDAARFRPRPWKQVLRRLDTAAARQFEASLSGPPMSINVNPTFQFVLVQDEHRK